MNMDREFHAIAHSQLAVDGVGMVFHRLFRYLELFADLLI